MTDHPAHVVYRRLLSRTGNGYPLWIPDPDENLPEAYRKDGINIGDVGLLTEDGGFDFLFNVHTPPNDPLDSGGVPWDFLPLSAFNDPHPIRKTSFIHDKKSCITSAHVAKKSIAMEGSADTGIFGGAGFGIQFSTRKAQAAVLVLPDGAHRYVAKNSSIYEKYASENGIAWYQYANGTLGRGASNGSLYLVTGCDKCRSWGTAAVSQPDETQEVSLKFVAAGIAEGGIALHSSWSADFGPVTRSFPPSNITVHDMENQCVFVRGITISVKESFIRRALRVEVGRWSGVPEDSRHKWFGGQSPAFPRSMSFHSTSPSTSSSSSGHSGRPHSDTHLATDGLALETDSDGEMDSEHSSDSDVEVSRFPLYSDAPQNLSSRIANHILSMRSDVTVAVVNDDAWMSVVNENSNFQTDDDEDLLIQEVLKGHDIDVFNGIARLCRHPQVLDVHAAISNNTIDETNVSAIQPPYAQGPAYLDSVEFPVPETSSTIDDDVTMVESSEDLSIGDTINVLGADSDFICMSASESIGKATTEELRASDWSLPSSNTEPSSSSSDNFVDFVDNDDYYQSPYALLSSSINHHQMFSSLPAPWHLSALASDDLYRPLLRDSLPPSFLPSPTGSPRFNSAHNLYSSQDVSTPVAVGNRPRNDDFLDRDMPFFPMVPAGSLLESEATAQTSSSSGLAHESISEEVVKATRHKFRHGRDGSKKLRSGEVQKQLYHRGGFESKRRFACDACSKTFAHRPSLVRHRQKHPELASSASSSQV